jgi:NTP-dependent ternary system trypsin peptidase co-occuring protein
MEVNSEDLSIKTLIQAVTKELRESQTERLAAGQDAVFQVSDLTLEISFVATTSKQGGGGFDLKVIKADAGVKYDRESVQKITLKLTAVDDQPFGGARPLRPRKVALSDK